MAFLSAINAALSPLLEKFICRFHQRFDQHVNVAFNIDVGCMGYGGFYQSSRGEEEEKGDTEDADRL